MKVNVYPAVPALPAEQLAGFTPVAVDTLRATSTIVTAMQSGARAVVPMLEPEEALAAARALTAGTFVLGGERGGVKIPGFDLGNSPAEYTAAAVAGKLVLFTTTNGTRVIRRAQPLGPVYILSFLNVGAVAAALWRAGADVAVACAGTGDQFSLEDIACAGALVDGLAALTAQPDMNDLAWAARAIYQGHQEHLTELLQTARHGQKLMRLGLQADLALCARQDIIPVVPVCRDGQITLA